MLLLFGTEALLLLLYIGEIVFLRDEHMYPPSLPKPL